MRKLALRFHALVNLSLGSSIHSHFENLKGSNHRNIQIRRIGINQIYALLNLGDRRSRKVTLVKIIDTLRKICFGFFVLSYEYHI